MNAHVLPNADVSYLDAVLMKNGLLQVVPFSTLVNIPQTHLSIWAVKNAIYTFPTTELIEWLQEKIAGRTAIEICAGNGAIGRALGIPRTDSYMQTLPDMVLYYRSIGQKPICPPPDVMRYEANEAIDKFKPEVVLGSYITQKYQEGDENTKTGSSIYGVDEIGLLKKVQMYIAIGSDTSHKDKRIRQFEHTTYRMPWLFSRNINPQGNEISVWDNQ